MQIKIGRDHYPENPREMFDHLGTMVCFHNRYKLGDAHDYTVDELDYLVGGGVISLPLYLYDHGGITISTTPFSCPWDSGQVGYIFMTREIAQRELGGDVTDELIREVLESEVEEYDQYLRGDVWNYAVLGGNGEVLDSCGGFYGREHCEQEAAAVLDYHQKTHMDTTSVQQIPSERYVIALRLLCND